MCGRVSLCFSVAAVKLFTQTSCALEHFDKVLSSCSFKRALRHQVGKARQEKEMGR